MYVRKGIREFINKMPKEMNLPKHWRKFVNENSKEYNLIIKHGSEYECTNCGKYFYSEQVPGRGCWDICPFCGGQYDVRRSNLKRYFFLYDLACIDNIDNKLIVRYFEVCRNYNHKIRRFTDSVVEYARIVPELGIELVNDRFVKYTAMEKVYHTSKIKKWRVFTGTYGLERYYRAIYVDNIEEKLKGTIYQYAPIAEAVMRLGNYKGDILKVLKKAKYSSFELLMKAGLYQLALDCPEKFNVNGNFEKRFGVKRQYYNFMKKHDISYLQLRVLQLTKRPNMDKIKRLLRISNDSVEKLEKASKYVDLIKLEEYSKKQKNFSIHSYLDYIRNLEKLEVTLKSKKTLFPEDFWQVHDESVKKVKIVGNTGIDKRIKKRYEQLSKNSYKDNMYFIRPAKTLEDMKNEAKQQHNCVYKNYSEDYAFGDTDIYFLRDAKNPKKSLVTIEVNDNKVVQSRIKYNDRPTKEQSEFIKKWENEVLKAA